MFTILVILVIIFGLAVVASAVLKLVLVVALSVGFIWALLQIGNDYSSWRGLDSALLDWSKRDFIKSNPKCDIKVNSVLKNVAIVLTVTLIVATVIGVIAC